jgi:hypothetical protein
MSVSSADFYAFSQATGSPVPEDPESRARIAPQVLEWRRNQLKQPEQGGGLLDTLGKIALGAGTLAAGIAGYRTLRNRYNATPAAVQVQEEVVRRAAQPLPQLRGVTATSPQNIARPPSPRPPTQPQPSAAPPLGQRNLTGGTAFASVPTIEEEFIAYRPDPKEFVSRQVAEARRQTATEQLLQAAESRRGEYQPDLPGVNATLMALRSPAGATAQETGELVAKAESRPLTIAPAQQNLFSYVKQAAEPEADVADRLLMEYNQLVERQNRADQRAKSSVREYQMQVQGKAMRVLDDIRQESLVDNQQAKAAFNVDQAINALDSGEDQTTGRVRQQLQRNQDVNLAVVDQLEDQTNNIDVVASMTPDGVPFDQAENVRRITPQEQVELAKQEMMLRRQQLQDAGFQPGTVRFERALAQPFRTSAATKVTGTGAIDLALPAGPIRGAVEAVSASEPLPERTVINVGPQAVVTSTAAGTAIRGAAPSYFEAQPKQQTRQLYGTPDVLVPGAPNELGPDIPGALRVRGGAAPDVEPQQMSKQEIQYSVLDRPTAVEPTGGMAGIGVYGIEPGYVPGAMSKSTGEYSEAASRQPSYVPGWLQKKESKGPFDALTVSQLESAAAKAQGPRIQSALETELGRRRSTQQSLTASEALRRGRIEGRDPNMVLRQLGFNV